MENRAEKRANKISVPFRDHSAHPSSLEAQGPVFSLRWTAPALDRWPVHRRSLCLVSTASLSHSLVGLVRGTHSSQPYPSVDTAGARTRRAINCSIAETDTSMLYNSAVPTHATVSIPHYNINIGRKCVNSILLRNVVTINISG